MHEPRPLPGEKVHQKEKEALTCKQCGIALEQLGLCKECKNYNLPARNGEYLLIKPDEFNTITISQTGNGETATITFDFPDFISANMTAAEIKVIGNENIEFGKILFAFWFQVHKDLFPRGERPRVREVRDYLDELISQRKWD